MQRTRMTRGIRAPSVAEVRRIVMQNLLEWNTPRSLSIFLILRLGKDSDILSLLDFRPEHFNSAESYAEFSFPTDLLRKSRILNLGIDTQDAALVRFHQAEELCRVTNSRLRLSDDPKGRLGELVHRVRKIILDTLPELDLPALDSLVELGGWGKGVTSTVRGRGTPDCPVWKSFHSKLVSDQHCTTPLQPIAARLQAELNGMDGKVSIRDYNKVAFVPKNYKTDRTIAVEPSLNAYLQRGVGVLLRRGLRRLGVDLIHGQLRNAALAKVGSIDGSFATVDLSMASDTLSRRLIGYLFPESWVSLLGILRSPFYLLKDGSEPVRYEKWSSMGNGYTFEVESLVFAACAKAVSGVSEWAVYGDDIIVPTFALQDLASLLGHFGFVLNSEKSFTTGPFRESCGKDYFLGVAVRGFYLKELNPATWFVWHNWLAAERLLPVCSHTMALLRSYSKCDRCVSPFPDDGAFWVPPFENHPLGLSRGRQGGFLGWYFNRVVFQPQTRLLSEHTDIGAVSTYCRLAKASEPTERVVLRESLGLSGKWVRKRVFVPDGFRQDLDGPWPAG